MAKNIAKWLIIVSVLLAVASFTLYLEEFYNIPEWANYAITALGSVTVVWIKMVIESD